jgi:hypothetical protein
MTLHLLFPLTLVLTTFFSSFHIAARAAAAAPLYLPHQIKEYQYCIPNNLFDINLIYVINTMDSFEGILIGNTEIEILCGEIQMTKECEGIPLPTEPANDLCEMTYCPIPEKESSLIAFHSSTPLPSTVTCGIRLEIMAGNWSSNLMMCQNLTTVSCIEFSLATDHS